MPEQKTACFIKTIITEVQLLKPDYQPQFTGHETFPLRYGWLIKVFDAVVDAERLENNKSIFRDEKAITRFGVGKNMVSSMRHWGKATGVVAEDVKTNRFVVTQIGRLYFDEKHGLDRYMEHPTTLWFLHWKLASQLHKTTWYWCFNVFARTTFDRETLVDGLYRLSTEQEWNRVSRNTIKRDVDCFIRSYVSRNNVDDSMFEEMVESPFSELGLIRSTSRRDEFQFIRGPKHTLSDNMLAAAVVEFWLASRDSNTLSLESLLYDAGSPGRVFLLDEEYLAERLSGIEHVSGGKIRWSESAGMRQLLRDKPFSKSDALALIQSDFSR